MHTDNYSKMATLTKDDYLQLSSHLISKPVQGALHQWPSLVWNLDMIQIQMNYVCSAFVQRVLNRLNAVKNAITNQLECCKQLILIQQQLNLGKENIKPSDFGDVD